MKGLTLFRPWDHAILSTRPGRKDVENRTRPCPTSVLGEEIAIHAGKTYSIGDWGWPTGIAVPRREVCATGIRGVARVLGFLDMRAPREPRIAIADRSCSFWAIGEYDAARHRLSQLHLDPWWSGPVGILLGRRTAIEAIPCNGAMGWWTVPVDVELVVRARVEAARSAA